MSFEARQPIMEAAICAAEALAAMTDGLDLFEMSRDIVSSYVVDDVCVRITISQRYDRPVEVA